MDAFGIAFLVGMSAVTVGLSLFWTRWRKKRIDATTLWPTTEATINSGEMKVVSRRNYQERTLPVFSFSYQVNGEYFSGYFALIPYITDPGTSLIDRMVGHTLQIRYNPARLDAWFIPDELIEGCKIEQKIAPHLLTYGMER